MKDGQKTLLVNPTYYEIFRDNLLMPPNKGVEQIAREQAWNIYVLTEEDENNITVNFTQLPDYKVLVTSPSQSTTNKLKEISGQNIISIPTQLVADQKSTGGLNCRINVFTHY